MFDAYFHQTLLQSMRREGAVGQRAFPRVRSLLWHGLSLEQALIGTGLMHPESYGFFLAQACGMPFVRVSAESAEMPAALSRMVCCVLEAVPISQHENRWIVAMTHPDETRMDILRQCARQGGWIAELRVILRSDWLTLRNRDSATAADASAFFNRLDLHGTHEVRVLPTRDGADVWMDMMTHDRPRMSWSMSQSPARMAAFARRLVRDGWAVSTHQTIHGPSLTASRVKLRTDAHPLSVCERIGAFLEKPDGLLILVRPDHALCKWMDLTTVLRANTPCEQEDVLHRALAGESIVVRSDHDNAWWKSAAHADIPVHVVRGHLTSSGHAWSISHDSL